MRRNGRRTRMRSGTTGQAAGGDVDGEHAEDDACFRMSWLTTAYGVSATAASGVATRKLKLSCRYRRTTSLSCES